MHYPEYRDLIDITMRIRIEQTTYFYNKHFGLGFYGFPIEDNECLDMLFAYIGLHWGIAAFCIIIFVAIYDIYYAAKKGDTFVLIILFTFFVYGCAETAPIYPTYSYFAIILGYYLMNNDFIRLVRTRIENLVGNG